MFTKRFSSHLDDRKSQSNGSINDDYDVTSDKQKVSPPTSSSTGWIKDKVTGSLNRLSTSSKMTLSADAVNTSYGEGPLETSEELPKLSKAQSELNLKTSTNGSAGVTVVDGVASVGSKRQWLKGQISAYLSKSKPENMSASVSTDNIPASTSNGTHDRELSDMSVPVHHRVTDEKPINIHPPSFNTLTSDESHLPLLDSRSASHATHNNINDETLQGMVRNQVVPAAIPSTQNTISSLRIVRIAEVVSKPICLYQSCCIRIISRLVRHHHFQQRFLKSHRSLQW